ncbi:YSIRK-type signal peptide-containing protein, partial [Staphylococcus aureus]
MFNNKNVRQRFSFRKLSVSTASVLIGTCFFLVGNSAHASETKYSDQSLQQENKVAKNNNQSLQQENKVTKNNNQSLQQENKVIKNNNQSLQQENKVAKNNNQSLQQENKVTKNNNQSLQQENKVTKNNNQSLQQENNNIENKAIFKNSLHSKKLMRISVKSNGIPKSNIATKEMKSNPPKSGTEAAYDMEKAMGEVHQGNNELVKGYTDMEGIVEGDHINWTVRLNSDLHKYFSGKNSIGFTNSIGEPYDVTFVNHKMNETKKYDKWGFYEDQDNTAERFGNIRVEATDMKNQFWNPEIKPIQDELQGGRNNSYAIILDTSPKDIQNGVTQSMTITFKTKILDPNGKVTYFVSHKDTTALPSRQTHTLYMGKDVLISEMQKKATDADQYAPKGKDQTVEQGQTLEAKNSIENLGDLPDGTKVDFKTPVDTSTPGDKDATVVVTYPDGTTDEVPAKVTVNKKATDADQYAPKGKDQTVEQGQTLEAKNSIENLGDLPDGT